MITWSLFISDQIFTLWSPKDWRGVIAFVLYSSQGFDGVFPLALIATTIPREHFISSFIFLALPFQTFLFFCKQTRTLTLYFYAFCSIPKHIMLLHQYESVIFSCLLSVTWNLWLIELTLLVGVNWVGLH
jgi:hypothetical protein